MDKQTRVIVVQTLVLSLIEYCIRIWGTTNDTVISSVQKLQNFAARVAVGGVKKYDHISPAFRELKWLRLKQKHLFDVGVTIFKVLQGFYPDWFLSLSSRQAFTSSITRQRHSLYVPRTNTHSGARKIERRKVNINENPLCFRVMRRAASVAEYFTILRYSREWAVHTNPKLVKALVKMIVTNALVNYSILLYL